MFWLNNNKNKIVSKENKIISCNKCPCGNYYTILGFKFRTLNQDTMQPYNSCGWQYTVQPIQVNNGKIRWSNYGCDLQIAIDQKINSVTTHKFKENCWEDCYQYNYETDDCMDPHTYCDCVIEVQIHNLVGRIGNYEKFAQLFYKNSNITPDVYGTYPAIWEDYYGYYYLTTAANNAIDNYWKKLFLDNHALNFTIRYQILGQLWWQNAGTIQWKMVTIYDDFCYNDQTQTWCDNQTRDENGRIIACNEPGCTVHTEMYQYQDYPMSVGCTVYMLLPTPNNGSYEQAAYKMHNAVASIDEGASWFNPTCLEYRDAYAAMQPCNQHIRSIAADKSKYTMYYGGGYYDTKGTGTWTSTCINSNNVCVSWDYSSGPFQNFYGSIENATILYHWSQFKLQRTGDTPVDAVGIKFELTLTRTQQNDGKGNISKQVTSLVQEIIVNFDEDYNTNLPTALDITLWTLIKNIECNNDDCSNDGCQIFAQPITNDYSNAYRNRWDQNVKRDSYNVHLRALEYTY